MPVNDPEHKLADASRVDERQTQAGAAGTGHFTESTAHFQTKSLGVDDQRRIAARSMACYGLTPPERTEPLLNSISLTDFAGMFTGLTKRLEPVSIAPEQGERADLRPSAEHLEIARDDPLEERPNQPTQRDRASLRSRKPA